MSNTARHAGTLLQPVFLALLVLLAVPAWAQDSSTADMVPRRLLLTVTADPPTAFTPNELFMVSRSVLLRLQQASSEISAVESSSEKAGDSGADSTLSLVVAGSWPALKVHAISRDMISQTTVLDATIQRDGWASSDNLADEDWNEIVGPLARSYHKVAAAATVETGPVLARLTIRALPGTLIFGPGGSKKLVGGDGTAFWDLSSDRTYSIRSRLLTYQPVSMGFFLNGDREIDLAQKKDAQWSFDASLMNLSTPRIGISGTLDPRGVFIRLGLSTSLLSIDLASGGLLRSDPLSTLLLQVGLYLTPEDSFVRLYWGLGAFLRVATPEGATPYIDQLSPWGQSMILGGEMFRSARGAFFVEWTPTFYATDVPELLEAALGSGNAPTGWIFNAKSVEELLAFRIGYRWNL